MHLTDPARLIAQSVVLHELNVDSVVSTFPISLGTKIAGVDDMTFTSTGEAYSMVREFTPLRTPHKKVACRTPLETKTCVACLRSPAQHQHLDAAQAPVGRRLARIRVRQEGKHPACTHPRPQPRGPFCFLTACSAARSSRATLCQAGIQTRTPAPLRTPGPHSSAPLPTANVQIGQSENLGERGVHEVSQRKFVLVAAVSIAN